MSAVHAHGQHAWEALTTYHVSGCHAQDRTQLLFHCNRGATAQETQHVNWLRLNLQQFLGVAFLHVPGEMILPAKPLGTVLAQEVLPPCMHHQVSPHILAGVEAPVTVVTRMLLLLGSTRSPPRMCLEVLQQDLGALEGLEAHLAAEVPTGRCMHGQVPPEAQLGVVVLATLRAVKSLLVGVVGLEVVPEVILPVKHLLTVHALMRLLSRVRGHVPLGGKAGKFRPVSDPQETTRYILNILPCSLHKSQAAATEHCAETQNIARNRYRAPPPASPPRTDTSVTCSAPVLTAEAVKGGRTKENLGVYDKNAHLLLRQPHVTRRHQTGGACVHSHCGLISLWYLALSDTVVHLVSSSS